MSGGFRNIQAAGGVGSSVAIGEIEAATLVIESEGISSNDNDTTIPTSAAVKDFVDTTVPAASVSAAGKIEVATAAETDTGSDAARAVSPDGLAGSSIFGVKSLQFVVFDFGTDTATGDGKFYFHVPACLNGMNIISIHGEVISVGTTGTLDIQLHNVTQAADILSTKLTIDTGESGSDTAATPAVIDTSEDDLQTNDVLRVDVDAVHSGTAAKGLIITLECQLP